MKSSNVQWDQLASLSSSGVSWLVSLSFNVTDLLASWSLTPKTAKPQVEDLQRCLSEAEDAGLLRSDESYLQTRYGLILPVAFTEALALALSDHSSLAPNLLLTMSSTEGRTYGENMEVVLAKSLLCCAPSVVHQALLSHPMHHGAGGGVCPTYLSPTIPSITLDKGSKLRIETLVDPTGWMLGLDKCQVLRKDPEGGFRADFARLRGARPGIYKENPDMAGADLLLWCGSDERGVEHVIRIQLKMGYSSFSPGEVVKTLRGMRDGAVALVAESSTRPLYVHNVLATTRPLVLENVSKKWPPEMLDSTCVFD